MKTWYHNITKQIFNESDLDDFFEDYDEGDVIMKSEDGCAIINPVTEQELKNMYTVYITQYDEEEEPLVSKDSMDEAFNLLFDNPTPSHLGLIIHERCTCGDYRPLSTSGVIDDNCANCRGRPPIIRMGV